MRVFEGVFTVFTNVSTVFTYEGSTVYTVFTTVQVFTVFTYEGSIYCTVFTYEGSIIPYCIYVLTRTLNRIHLIVQ